VTELQTTTSSSWSTPQAIALVVFSLLLGACGGWLIRRSFTALPHGARQFASARAPNVPPGGPVPPSFSSVPSAPSPKDLKMAADSQAAPLLEQLNADPGNAELLAKVGNIYYDAKQYPTAIDYYERSLKLQPTDTAVRTDLGTAYWYEGDADAAIREFQKALSYEPSKANALFNLGIVKWKGKNDALAAIEDWQKLLATNPGFAARAKVEYLITQARDSLDKKP
jgi:Tetratricopeptide repeat/TPR repeat